MYLLPWTYPLYGYFPWDLPVVIGFCALAVFAACYDAMSFRVPNWLTGTIAALFVPVALAAPMPVDWLGHLGAGALVLTGGALLFAVRVIGGGDVKLAAALALWVGYDALPGFVVTFALIGGALTITLLIARTILGFAAIIPQVAGFGMPRLFMTGQPVPYGVAISGGALVSVPLMPLLQAFV